jgi:hypothetical protein
VWGEPAREQPARRVLTGPAADPPALAEQLEALAVPIASGVQSFTRSQVARVVLALGLAVAGGALPTGQSITAVRARQGLSNAIGWVAGSAERTGKVVLGLPLALLVVLAIIEFLGRRPAQRPVEATTTTGQP